MIFPEPPLKFLSGKKMKMSNALLLTVFAVLSYLIGTMNWAVFISKLKKSDIRKLGSGNPGTLNMSRNFGLKLGLLTFFLDVLKGAIPVLVAFFVFRDRGFFVGTNFKVVDLAIYLCGFFAVIGHIYPVWFKFKGGKGIASTIGVFLVCESVCWLAGAGVAIMSIVAAVVWIYFTEFGAMGSFIATVPPAISGSIRLALHYGTIGHVTSGLGYYIITNLLIFSICFFTWFAHKKNIQRMLAGEEHPTSIKEMVIKMKAKKAEQQDMQSKTDENSVENK